MHHSIIQRSYVRKTLFSNLNLSFGGIRSIKSVKIEDAFFRGTYKIDGLTVHPGLTTILLARSTRLKLDEQVNLSLWSIHVSHSLHAVPG